MIQRTPKTYTVNPSHIVLLAALLVLGTLGVLHSGWLQRLDLMIYDLMLTQQQRQPTARVTIVAIDEASLQQIGRWPWSRQVHAGLIDRLTEAGARAVALDLPLHASSRRDPSADSSLADAIARNGRVVLPVAPAVGAGPGYQAERRPIPLFTRNAAALGHTELQIDPDGRVRRLHLYAGLNQARWPALALAMFEVGTGERDGPQPTSDTEQAGAWSRKQPVLIPYAGKAGHFPHLSYADVLNGRIDPTQLRDRYVLVGPVAPGIGRAVSTPMAPAYHRMSGIELDANILAGLLRRHRIEAVPTWQRNLLTVMLVGAPLVLLIARGNRQVLTTLGGALALTLSVSALLLYLPGLWFPPGAPVLSLALACLILNRVRLKRSVQEAARSTRHTWRVTKADGVTGLPVRERLLQSLHTSLAETARDGKLLGLLVINLKRFKKIRNQHGQDIADRILAQAARRMREVVRQDDLMVRLGRDEFAIAMAGLDNRRPVRELSKRIRSALAEPFDIGHESLQMRAHFAAAMFPADGRDPETLLASASAAMQRTREQREDRIGFRVDQVRAEAGRQQALEPALRNALDLDEFEIQYQPQVTARDARVVGVEALLRWVSPAFGVVPPETFIPIAERNGMILPIGAWVLNEACRQAQHWFDRGLPSLRIAVKISAVQLRREGLVDTVSEILNRTGIDPNLLELEVNDECLARNGDTVAETLETIKRLGVRVAFDNLGAGYCSLHALTSLPFDRIKISRELVRYLDNEQLSPEITAALINLAHEHKLEVVGVGVETAAQQQRLLAQGCDEMQGHLFTTALPADALQNLLERSIHLTPRNEPAEVALAT